MALHIRYFLGESLRVFRKAKWISMVTVTTIGLLLFLMTCVLLVFWHAHRFIQTVGSRMEIVAFTGESYASIDSAVLQRRAIESIDGVQRAKWVSKDSAISVFKNLYGTEMLESVEGNPLPASFYIEIVPGYRQADSLEILQTKIGALSGVESVQYGKEWLPRLEKIRKIFAISAVLASLGVLIALYWIISNTIHFAVLSRREILEIMRYVGATPSFTKIPFYLEGLIMSLLGSFLSLCLLMALLCFVRPYAPELTAAVPHPFMMSLPVYVLGIAVTLFSTRQALKKRFS